VNSDSWDRHSRKIWRNGTGQSQLCHRVRKAGFWGGFLHHHRVEPYGDRHAAGRFFGTEEQRKKYLPGLCSGRLIGAFGLTEPEAGSDALNPRTVATLSADGTHYILNGSKQFITNAGFADVIFTYAKVDEKHFTAFIVEQNWKAFPSMKKNRRWECMGLHASLSLRQREGPGAKCPGRSRKGHLVALNALNMGRYKVAPSALEVRNELCLKQSSMPNKGFSLGNRSASSVSSRKRSAKWPSGSLPQKA